MKIQVKQVENLKVPTAATPYSSGYDVVSISEPEIIGECINLRENPEKEKQQWKRIDYIQYRTGLFISPQTDSYNNNYHTLIFPRSSVSKYNLVLANCIGLVDNDYRGELLLRFKYIWQPEDFKLEYRRVYLSDGGNDYSYEPTGNIFGLVNYGKIYKKEDKIGQLVSEVTNPVEWIVVADLSQTIRDSGGFGSTDNKQALANEHKPSPLLSLFKESAVNVPHHADVSYETMVKEREKQI